MLFLIDYPEQNCTAFVPNPTKSILELNSFKFVQISKLSKVFTNSFRITMDSTRKWFIFNKLRCRQRWTKFVLIVNSNTSNGVEKLYSTIQRRKLCIWRSCGNILLVCLFKALTKELMELPWIRCNSLSMSDFGCAKCLIHWIRKFLLSISFQLFLFL